MPTYYQTPTASITPAGIVTVVKYERLDQSGLNQDQVSRSFAVLEANFGDGYGAGALVGSAAGTMTWVLSASALPTQDIVGTEYDIQDQDRANYYWDFYQRHLAAGNKPFLFRCLLTQRDFFASFVDRTLSYEVFTKALYGTGIALRSRRVPGNSFQADGSIAPNPPTGFQVESFYTTSTSIQITWTASAVGFYPFNYEIKLNGGVYSDELITIGTNTTQEISGTALPTGTGTPLVTSTTYSVMVRAKDLFGNYSDWTEELSETTL